MSRDRVFKISYFSRGNNRDFVEFRSNNTIEEVTKVAMDTAKKLSEIMGDDISIRSVEEPEYSEAEKQQ